MNYYIQYLESEDFFLVKTSGHMSADDFIQMAEGILSHSNWAAGKNVLFDHRDLNFENITLEIIEKIRRFHEANEKRIGAGRSAILLKAGSIDKWNIVWDEGDKIKSASIVQIFDDNGSAIKWINEKNP